nr:hypothetical protein [Tanacetum cinerariifolium]
MLNDDDDDFSTKIEPGSHKENLEVVDDEDDDVKKDDENNDEDVEKMNDVAKEVLDHCNNIVHELMFAKTNEMIKEEMPRMVDLTVQKDREIASTSVPELISKEFATHGPKMVEELFRKQMQNTTLNLYPTSSTPSLSTATMSTADHQYQLYLNMKSKPQDQAADPDL